MASRVERNRFLPRWVLSAEKRAEEVVQATESLVARAPHTGALSEAFLQGAFDDMVAQRRDRGESSIEAQRVARQVVSAFVFERMVDLVATGLEGMDDEAANAFSEEAEVVRRWMFETTLPAADSSRKDRT